MFTPNLGIQFQPSDDHSQTDILRVPENTVPLYFCSDIRFCSSPRNVRQGSLYRVHQHSLTDKCIWKNGTPKYILKNWYISLI